MTRRTSLLLLLAAAASVLVVTTLLATGGARPASSLDRDDGDRPDSSGAQGSSALAPRPDSAETAGPAGGAATWIARLRQGETADDRREAAERLTGQRTEAAEQALARASREDASPDVREAALEALAGSDSLAVVRAYVDALGDEELWVRDAAETGLYRFKDRDVAVGAVATLCAHTDRDLRIRAAELLDEMVPEHLPWDEIHRGPVTFAWAPASPFTGGEDAK